MTGPALIRSAEPRSARIGASDVAAVLGLSPWRTPFGVWASKQPNAETSGDTPVTRRGHYLEAGLLRWLGDEVGALQVVPGDPFDGPWVVAAEGRWPHVGVHPDGYLLLPPAEGDGGTGWHAGEIKTARQGAEWGEGPEEYPPHVWIQVQVQAAVSGLRVRLGAYLPLSEQFRVYAVEPDPVTAAEMLDRAEAWYVRHVLGDEPPPLDGSDDARRWLLSRFPRHRQPLRPATDAEAGLVRELAAAKAALRAAEAEEKRLAALVQAAIGDAEGVELVGGKATWKAQNNSRVDVKRLQAEAPEVAAQYTTTTLTRVLRVSVTEEER